METKCWRGSDLLLNGDEWHTGARITELSRRENLGPWVHQYHPHQPHWGPSPMHPPPCDLVVVSEHRPQPLLSYKVCILCFGTVYLPWRFDFLDSPWTCLSISDSSGNQWTVGWSDLLFMVGTVPLHTLLSPLTPSLPLLWRPHLLPDKNTIISWFGSSTLKEKILFIEILAVFCWYTGESVMNKTELNLEFHSNGQNSLFQAQSCKAYLSHKSKATWKGDTFC